METKQKKEYPPGKFQLDAAIDYQSAAVVSKTLINRPSGNITLFAFDEGQGLSEHTAPFDAVVQIMDGEAEITISEESHFLSSGESIILPAGIPHSLKAVKRFKMLLTLIK